MRRRQFVGFLGGAAAWPLAGNAQQARPTVGVLFGVHLTPLSRSVLDAFRSGLNEAGFVEGRNVTVDVRWADGKYEQLPAMVNELVRHPVKVIVAIGAPAATAAKATTATTPVVFYMGEDPVSLGLVSSLNRPGGNVTGIAYLSSAVLAKRLELLRELVPPAGVFAVLINPNNPNAEISTRDAEAAARTLNEHIQVLRAGTPAEFEAAFLALGPMQARALLIAPDGSFNANAAQLAELSMRQAIPASHEYRAFAAAGGLMSYGGSILEGVRLAGIHTARILKGEKPADLPVMQPSKFELVINLKAAKTMGLTVPATLLAAADEVIE